MMFENKNRGLLDHALVFYPDLAQAEFPGSSGAPALLIAEPARPEEPELASISLDLPSNISRPKNTRKHEADLTHSIGRKFGLDPLHSRKAVDVVANRYDLPRDLALEYVENNDAFAKSFSRQLRSEPQSWDQTMKMTIGDAENSHVADNIEATRLEDDGHNEFGQGFGAAGGAILGGLYGLGFGPAGAIVGNAIGGAIGLSIGKRVIRIPNNTAVDRMKKRARDQIRKANPQYP